MSIVSDERVQELLKNEQEIERLKHFLAACAAILQRRVPVTTDFIAELRKAAE